jgi:hypothetical protein
MLGDISSSYALLDDVYYMCKLPADKWHNFELPNGTFKTRAELKGIGDVVGCGILFESKQKMSIFFTLNGILLGQFSSGVGKTIRNGYDLARACKTP